MLHFEMRLWCLDCQHSNCYVISKIPFYFIILTNIMLVVKIVVGYVFYLLLLYKITFSYPTFSKTKVGWFICFFPNVMFYDYKNNFINGKILIHISRITLIMNQQIWSIFLLFRRFGFGFNGSLKGWWWWWLWGAE